MSQVNAAPPPSPSPCSHCIVTHQQRHGVPRYATGFAIEYPVTANSLGSTTTARAITQGTSSQKLILDRRVAIEPAAVESVESVSVPVESVGSAESGV